MKRITYNNIIDKFRALADDHKQISTYLNGEIPTDISPANIVYPLLYTKVNRSNISENQVSIAFDLFFLDRLNDSKLNVDEVLSDEFQKAQDFIAVLNEDYSDDGIIIETSEWGCEPLVEVEDDRVAGWAVSVNIIFPNIIENCYLPFKSRGENIR